MNKKFAASLSAAEETWGDVLNAVSSVTEFEVRRLSEVPNFCSESIFRFSMTASL